MHVQYRSIIIILYYPVSRLSRRKIVYFPVCHAHVHNKLRVHGANKLQGQRYRVLENQNEKLPIGPLLFIDIWLLTVPSE